MSRFWKKPESIVIQADSSGTPQVFVWRGETCQVNGISNNWIFDEGWGPNRTWRHYFKLTTTAGWLVYVYRDLLTGQWYLARLFD